MSRSDLPPLNWLRAFEASARHLSFTGAAAELNMTQSAVSQQIKTLEAHLGRQLFHRRPRRLELTEAAKSYLPAVQDAFATLAHGTRAILGPGAEQVLQVQSNMGFAVLWLAPRLNRLFALHPWLRLNVTTAIWQPERTAATADVEIRFGRSPGEGVAAERLTRDRFYPVCAPGYPVEEATLLSVPLYDCADMLCTWEAWFAGQGRALPRATPITYASTYAFTLAAAAAGCGVALAHDTLAGHMIETGRLVRPFAHAEPMEEAYFLLAPDAASASPAARAFCEWIRAECYRPASIGKQDWQCPLVPELSVTSLLYWFPSKRSMASRAPASERRISIWYLSGETSRHSQIVVLWSRSKPPAISGSLMPSCHAWTRFTNNQSLEV